MLPVRSPSEYLTDSPIATQIVLRTRLRWRLGFGQMASPNPLPQHLHRTRPSGSYFGSNRLQSAESAVERSHGSLSMGN